METAGKSNPDGTQPLLLAQNQRQSEFFLGSSALHVGFNLSDVHRIVQQGRVRVSKELELLQAHAVSAEADSSATKEIIALMENKNERLREQLDKLQEQGKVDEVQIAMLQEELSAVHRDIEDVRKQLQAKTADKTADNARLGQQIESLQRNNIKLSKDMKDVRKQLQAMTAEKAALNKKVVLLGAKVEVLEGAVSDADVEKKKELRTVINDATNAAHRAMAAAAQAESAAAQASLLKESVASRLAEVTDSLLLRQVMYTLHDRVFANLKPRCADKEATTIKEIFKAGLKGGEDVDAATKAALPGLTLRSDQLRSVFTEVLCGGSMVARPIVLPQHRPQLMKAAEGYPLIQH